MRYTEPKERSAELLRMALAHMGRHEAPFNPITFTLWYEYAAGINPPLSAEIDSLAGDAAHFDNDTVLRLHSRHVAPVDALSIERIGSEMQSLMTSVADSASRAGSRAGTFGAQLSGLTAALVLQDVEQLSPRLNEVLASTTEMKTSVDALQRKVATSQDEIKRLRGELERARDEVLHDPLTGILNRKGFDQRLRSLLAQPAAEGTSHCLVLLDIDHFKKVNDLHGHLMGDRVIQAVGEILRTSVTHATHATARYGGEEFAILLPQTPLEQCVQLAEAVRQRTRAMKIRKRGTQEVLATVTISAGVAAMEGGDDAARLIARADSALYESKKTGRDRVTRA